VELQLIVLPTADEEAADTAQWSLSLLTELENHDAVAEVVAESGPVPGKAKGEGGFTSLLAQLPLTAIDAIVQFVRAWAGRSGRTVQATIDGDTICIQGANREQTDQVLAAWVARHSSGT
jgi:hypothetical protein